MKVITSINYEEPTFEKGLVRLESKRGDEPEFVAECKYVDKVRNLVYFYNGPLALRTLSKSSGRRVMSS